jgi:hypothetical protein
MKTRIVVSLFFACGLVIASLVLVLGLRSVPASAERQLPDEARAWTESIKTGSAEWNVQKNIEDTARAKRQELELTVSGLRLSLCARYHLAVDSAGTVVEAANCSSFQ